MPCGVTNRRRRLARLCRRTSRRCAVCSRTRSRRWRAATGAGSTRLTSMPFSSNMIAACEGTPVADPAAVTENLAAALGLWRGPPLPELADHEVGAAEARRLLELRMQVEDDLCESRLVRGGDGELIADL